MNDDLVQKDDCRSTYDKWCYCVCTVDVGCQAGRDDLAGRVTDAVLKGPGNVVTVPAAGTFLVVDGVVRRASEWTLEDDLGDSFQAWTTEDDENEDAAVRRYRGLGE